MKRFYEIFNIRPDTKVLDVGGGLLNWTFVPYRPKLTILNILPPSPAEISLDVEWIIGDARCMPFKDKSFDVVFSNSVIEHVGNYDDQKMCAEEIRRVGKCYFVQTPNFYFPVEPHLITPFVHWLPRKIAKKFIKLTLSYLISRDESLPKRYFEEVRLLTPKEMKQLFPDAIIEFERWLGIPKSIYTIKNYC